MIEEDSVALTATSGSGNAGSFTIDTDDSQFTDSGTFTNSGTFADQSSGFTQTLAVGDFVNTGTLAADGGGFITGRDRNASLHHVRVR